MICDKKVHEKLKGKLYRMVVRPALMYGLETVAITVRQQKMLEVAEMRMLHFSIGYTRKDRVKNENIRERMGIGQLDGKLRETRLHWYGHVQRKEDTYIGRKVMAWDFQEDRGEDDQEGGTWTC